MIHRSREALSQWLGLEALRTWRRALNAEERTRNSHNLLLLIALQIDTELKKGSIPQL